VLQKNSNKYDTYQVEHKFTEKDKTTKILVTRDYKSKGSGNSMEIDSCTVLGIAYSERDTMPYFSKGS